MGTERVPESGSPVEVWGSVPRFRRLLSSGTVLREPMREPVREAVMSPVWTEDEVRPVALDALDERYRRYRLRVPAATRAMTGSLRRYGQISPVVVCRQEDTLVLIDGFKRLEAARSLKGFATLGARPIAVDEHSAKAAVYLLNRVGRQPQELEEAWIVQALVREDGLSQVEAARLLGHHKSWVCRRLALLERLCDDAREELKLGLLYCPRRTLIHSIRLIPRGRTSQS